MRLARRGRLLRPFSRDTSVTSHSYSRHLQRVLADFGAEGSFARSVERIREHYGLTVPVSAVRQYTLLHGRHIPALPAPGQAARQIVTQMDGSLIPVMQPGQGADRRKAKQLCWREVKLCCARRAGSVQTTYGATLGSAETAAWLWRETAQASGWQPRSRVHGVGDGAPWIVDQFLEVFLGQGTYLLDFYHASQYLAAAAAKLARPGKEKPWLQRQQGRLLNNQADKILRSLAPHQETEGAETPVKAAYRYLHERLDHLDYAGARARNLPIGSGEIESGHRHVVQQRLKLPGCWWKETNAAAMLNLRVARANNLWLNYWNSHN